MKKETKESLIIYGVIIGFIAVACIYQNYKTKLSLASYTPYPTRNPETPFCYLSSCEDATQDAEHATATWAAEEAAKWMKCQADPACSAVENTRVAPTVEAYDKNLHATYQSPAHKETLAAGMEQLYATGTALASRPGYEDDQRTKDARFAQCCADNYCCRDFNCCIEATPAGWLYIQTLSAKDPSFKTTIDSIIAQATMTALVSRSGSIQISLCPQGCRTHVPGCDIKGNISFDTKEKIYYIPGQLYYGYHRT
jgi:hypothetical protein